jgi:hypothetical protein
VKRHKGRADNIAYEHTYDRPRQREAEYNGERSRDYTNHLHVGTEPKSEKTPW